LQGGALERTRQRPLTVFPNLFRTSSHQSCTCICSPTACTRPTASASFPPLQDFNYLLQVDDQEERGRPRITAAKLCSTIPSCKDRDAFAICPNVYRDCKTGKLLQADPTQRCNSWSVCESVDLDGGIDAGDRKNGAGSRSAAAAAATALGGAAAALLALV
jgi:hypothetical protein